MRGVVGALVALGYLAGLSATTAGAGLALGAHVATQHAERPGDGAPQADGSAPRAVGQTLDGAALARIEAADAEADAEAAPRDAVHDHAHGHAHRHASAHDHAPPSAEPPMPGADRGASGGAAADGVHSHGGRAHQHRVPEPPPGAPAPLALDKHRLPERPALAPPSAQQGEDISTDDAWASAERSVETPPPERG